MLNNQFSFFLWGRRGSGGVVLLAPDRPHRGLKALPDYILEIDIRAVRVSVADIDYLANETFRQSFQQRIKKSPRRLVWVPLGCDQERVALIILLKPFAIGYTLKDGVLLNDNDSSQCSTLNDSFNELDLF